MPRNFSRSLNRKRQAQDVNDGSGGRGRYRAAEDERAVLESEDSITPAHAAPGDRREDDASRTPPHGDELDSPETD